jgi:hypothetical protein
LFEKTEKWIKAALAIVVVLIVVFVGVAYYLSSLPQLFGTVDEDKWLASHPSETLSMQAVVYNGTENSVYLYVQSLQSLQNNVTVNAAIITDSSGVIHASIPIADKTVYYNLEVIRINCTLASGVYTVTLVSIKGASFVSPLFIVP